MNFSLKFVISDASEKIVFLAHLIVVIEQYWLIVIFHQLFSPAEQIRVEICLPIIFHWYNWLRAGFSLRMYLNYANSYTMSTMSNVNFSFPSARYLYIKLAYHSVIVSRCQVVSTLHDLYTHRSNLFQRVSRQQHEKQLSSACVYNSDAAEVKVIVIVDFGFWERMADGVSNIEKYRAVIILKSIL